MASLYIGPYSIKRIVNQNAVTLELPDNLKIHPTIHVSLLKPYGELRDTSTLLPPPPTVLDPNEYEVHSILDSRMRSGKLQYLIRWKNFSSDEDSWEPAYNLKAPRLISAFHRRHPDRPHPVAVEQLP
ncbi:M-phase phosphoprotein 8-like [Bombina bombina]|uniref:M-phase phosphoprotein 8-like n=1 Tax=Bombina bombina TaxID=8345 RepID=UPI00235B2E9F|nr:M-phase phosphoprotein 8-like [Bombina bombina]